MAQTLTSVLEERRQPVDGLRRAVTMSLALHLAVAAVAVVIPRVWPKTVEAEPVYVTINFGVADQLDTTGRTTAGGRPVEQVAPPPKRPTPVQPATPKTQSPLSIGAKPKTPPKPAATPAATPSPPRQPTTGVEQTKGSTPADTGVKGQGQGISIASGGLGAQTLDATFCCPEWAQQAQRLILRGWKEFQPEMGVNEVVVTIRRDGTFAPAEIAKPSGSFQLDDESLRPFRELKGRLLPLPQKYEGDTLRIRFRFEYKR